jgi:branched-chain amino acid transport system substrate-binding protein
MRPSRRKSMIISGIRFGPVVKILALVSAFALVLVACGGEGTEETTTTPVDDTEATTTTEPGDDGSATTEATDGTDAPGGDPIRVGGTLGLTGAFAGPSDHYRTYYEAAVADINDRGGLLGRPVELILYDDESTQATAQGLYERLVNEDNVDILLAPYTTLIGGAVVPIARDSGKPMINAGFVGWEIARQYDRIFYTWTIQDPTYTRPFFEWLGSLPEDDRPQRMALLVAQNPFTIVERDGSSDGEGGVLNYAEDLGIEIVVNEEYPADITDPSPLLQRAMDEDADLLVVLGLPQDSILMARTVAEVGYSPAAYCTCGSTMNAFPAWTELGEAGNYVFGNNPAWTSDPFPGMDQAIAVSEGLGLEPMPPYAPMSIAAFQVIEQAVEGAGTVDPEALADYMYANVFPTAVGDIDFDEFGIPAFSGSLLQYVDGEVFKVWPEEEATAEAIYPAP